MALRGEWKLLNTKQYHFFNSTCSTSTLTYLSVPAYLLTPQRFARIRLSLRFELLCLDSSLDASDTGKADRCPSVGLKKIQKLSRLGAHEDNKQGVNKSISTPDLVGYFGNMLY